MNEDAARLLSKLRGFVESCTPEEKALMAVLLAPGLNELADAAGDDVQGYAMTGLSSPSLADALAAAFQHRHGGYSD